MQKDGSTPIRAIDPASLHEPSSRAGARRSPVALRMLVALVFIVLAGCVVIVFLVLPEYVNEARQPDRTPGSPARTEDTSRETASPACQGRARRAGCPGTVRARTASPETPG